VPLYRFPGGRTVLFIHIPKAAGTSIAAYLRSHPNVVQAFFSPDMGKRRALGLPCTPQHLHAELVRYMFGPDFIDWSFAVVRDPLQRIISEYRWRHRLQPELAEDILSWWRARRSEFKTNPYILDNHVRPQHEFPLEDTQIFRFEDGMDRVLVALSERLDIPPPKDLGSHHQNPSPKLPADISDEFIAEIREFYREDYRRFGY
jgi:hypothetical protein